MIKDEKMNRKVIAAALLLIGCLGLAGCSGDDDATGLASTPISKDSDPTPEVVNTEVTDEGGTIVDRPVVDGKKQSYLTGEWKDEAIVDRRPMAVMIPNNKAAMPQYGISKASIIFEAPMEWLSCTRLMGVFEDYDELDHIGPLRSARHYFVYESMTLDAIYCNWGLTVPLAGPFINSDRVDNVSASVLGIDDPSDEAFARDEKRKAAGYATEYTGIMTIDGYNAAVARHKYSVNHKDSFEEPFVFAQDGTVASYPDMTDVTKISPGGYTNEASGGGYGHGLPYFIYDPSDHLFHRYQFGEPQIDEYNNEELTCRNVIFQITSGEYYDDTTGYLNFAMNGLGPAFFFTEGKAIPGYWVRNDVDSESFKYYDNAKNPIVFNQGKTWICLVWDQYEDLITYE